MTSNFRRWAALVIVCFGQLMIMVDTTIVNVALPYMQRDLGFSQANLTWVVNAYLIAYGSFLLVAGRLGDLIGRRKVFLAGVFLFTVASIGSGFAQGADEEVREQAAEEQSPRRRRAGERANREDAQGDERVPETRLQQHERRGQCDRGAAKAQGVR